ncbi:UbiA family prenyltransferase [uncultured Serinicoccus sp.]|uniref:UbiA family prenyltransferase n=1 Tax=uncultured Serinicoccus sp. TaxID=735514 RepID=UPI002601BF7A|nr:UbiA family prenyltransferase [uncultured Serinicoccus sp.]
MSHGGPAGPTSVRLRAAVRMSRPDQVLLILAVYAVGWVAGTAGVGAGGAALPRPGAVLTALVVLAVATSVHVVNEFADVQTDVRTVRTRFSGGSGALQEHGLPAVFALRVAVVAAALAAVLTVLGLATGTVSGLVALLLTLGLVGGWAYSVGPWPFSRHGWGEVANALLGGLLLPATGAVVAGAALGPGLLTFLPFALLTFVNLLETQWADRDADRAAGKHTLATRLPAPTLRRLGAVTGVTAYGLSLVVHPWPVALAGLLAAPLSALGVHRLTRRSGGRAGRPSAGPSTRRRYVIHQPRRGGCQMTLRPSADVPADRRHTGWGDTPENSSPADAAEGRQLVPRCLPSADAIRQLSTPDQMSKYSSNSCGCGRSRVGWISLARL